MTVTEDPFLSDSEAMGLVAVQASELATLREALTSGVTTLAMYSDGWRRNLAVMHRYRRENLDLCQRSEALARELEQARAELAAAHTELNRLKFELSEALATRTGVDDDAA